MFRLRQILLHDFGFTTTGKSFRVRHICIIHTVRLAKNFLYLCFCNVEPYTLIFGTNSFKISEKYQFLTPFLCKMNKSKIYFKCSGTNID